MAEPAHPEAKAGKFGFEAKSDSLSTALHGFLMASTCEGT